MEETNLLDTDYARMILRGLQYPYNTYLGTVSAKNIAERRRKNKVAGKQRQVNRKNGSGK